MIFRLLLIVSLFTLVWEVAAQENRVIFVSPFANDTGDKAYDHAMVGFGDLVGVLLSTHEQIAVVERMGRAAIDAERKLQQSGLTGEAKSKALAKMLQADSVLTGRLFFDEKGKLGVSVKALDIDTEQVVAVDFEVVEESSFDKTLETLANRFAKKMQINLPEVANPELDDRPFASLYFGKGLSRYYSGNLDAAIMNFMRALDLDPDYVEAHYFSGLCYQQLKEPAHAVIEWQALVKKKPGFALSVEEKQFLENNSGKKE